VLLISRLFQHLDFQKDFFIMPWQTAPVMVIMVATFTGAGLAMPVFQRFLNGGKVRPLLLRFKFLRLQTFFRGYLMIEKCGNMKHYVTFHNIAVLQQK
jgi:hypothetical protein